MLDMLPTERIGRATWLLAQGRAMTVRELAQTLEITPRGARPDARAVVRCCRWSTRRGVACGQRERTTSDGEVA